MVVTVPSPDAHSGKPRPAVVVQADRWLQAHSSVTLCPLTSTLREAPLLPIQAVGEVVGQLEPDRLLDLDLALCGWLELP